MKIIAAIAALSLVATSALAQGTPNFTFGQVPTAAQWNSYFAAKQNYPIPSGTITNSMMVNPSVVIAGHTVALGASQNLACTDLTGSSAACSTSIGTAGSTIPLLSGANSWGQPQTFTQGIVSQGNISMVPGDGIGIGCTPGTAQATTCMFNSFFTSPRAGGQGLELFQFDNGVSNSGLHYGISAYEDFMPSTLPTGPIGLSPDGILGTIWSDPTVSFCRGAGSGCSNNWNIALLSGVFGQGYMWSNSSGLGLTADTMVGIIGAAQLGNGPTTGEGTLKWAVAVDADLTDSDYNGDSTTKGQLNHAVGLAVRPSPCDNGRSMGAAAGDCRGIYFAPYYSDPDGIAGVVAAPNGGSISSSTGQPITIFAGTAGNAAVVVGKPVMFSALPTCGSAAAPSGSTANITDGGSPTYRGAAAGGGSAAVRLYCAVTTWLYD